MRATLVEQDPLFLEVNVSGDLLAVIVKNARSEFSIPQEFEQLIVH